MILFVEANAKDLFDMSKNKICTLVALLRDLNYAIFMGISYKLYLIIEDGECIGILYKTFDHQEEKNIVSLFSYSESAIKSLEAMVNGVTTMSCPPLLQLEGMSYFNGGFYEKKSSNRCCCGQTSNLQFVHMQSLVQEKDIICKISLPTNDIDKYISWLDHNTEEYAAFEKEKIVSIVCILIEPVNIISFYWDSCESGSNIKELLNYCCADYDRVFAMAPFEKEPFLLQQGFSRMSEWRLFYNEL